MCGYRFISFTLENAMELIACKPAFGEKWNGRIQDF
jgi:hypothetical protein